MTTLHKPVLIESAEQAEKLPAFTVARYIDGDVRAAIKTIDGLWESIPGFYGEEAYFPEDFIGWTALVPIEAEEETREHPTRVEERPESAYLQPVQQVRYKTRWESA